MVEDHPSNSLSVSCVGLSCSCAGLVAHLGSLERPSLGGTIMDFRRGLGLSAGDKAEVSRGINHPALILTILDNITLDAPLLVDSVRPERVYNNKSSPVDVQAVVVHLVPEGGCAGFFVEQLGVQAGLVGRPQQDGSSSLLAVHGQNHVAVQALGRDLEELSRSHPRFACECWVRW